MSSFPKILISMIFCLTIALQTALGFQINSDQSENNNLIKQEIDLYGLEPNSAS